MPNFDKTGPNGDGPKTGRRGKEITRPQRGQGKGGGKGAGTGRGRR